MIEVDEIRNMAIKLHGFDKIDENYTFYYDETNNIGHLLIKPNGLNIQDPKCYVLGGIVHKGSWHQPSIAQMKSKLRIQESAAEIKLKNLARGNFIELLSSRKIAVFLNWLLSEEIYVHYQALDIIYWSVVDIVDSILAELQQSQLFDYVFILKGDLYEVLRYDHDCTMEIFGRYSYPKVGRQRRKDFIRELINLLKSRRWLLQDLNYEMLNGVLKLALDLQSLPFLENETSNVLIDRFSEFYSNRICLFKNSDHIMDIEKVVEKNIRSFRFMDRGKLITNYRFVDSKCMLGIQASDIVVGLLGKFFTFINRSTCHELFTIKSSLSAAQRETLSKFKTVVDSSNSENCAFSMRIISYRDDSKGAFFLEV